LARWIAPAGAKRQTGVYFRVRKPFDLARIPQIARIQIAAESIYHLYVNGTRIGQGPVRGTHTVNFFDTYDIAEYLRAGQNWIAAAVHCPNRMTFKYSPVEPGVLIQSDELSLQSDSTWQAQIACEYHDDAPLYTYQIGRMEWKDHRDMPMGWETGADASGWESAVVLAKNERLSGKLLRARDIPELCTQRHSPVDVPLVALTPPIGDVSDTAVACRMTVEPHRPSNVPINITPLLSSDGAPVVIHPSADGSGTALIFDFASEINGSFELDVDAPAGTVVDIGYEEVLRDGRLVLSTNEYQFADRYILREGRDRVGTEFAERGFRYAQAVFRNFNRPIHLHRVEALNVLYPYVERGTFTSSDSMLNQLWSTCEQTLRACTTDTFVDCPWRENTLYLNDLIVENITSLQAFGDARIVERSVRLAASQVRPDALFPAAVPWGHVPGMTPQESCNRMTLTAGNLTFPLILEEYLLYTGDRKGIEEIAELMLPMLARFESWEDESGLARPPKELWNFIDWSYPLHIENRTTATLEWLRVLAIDSTARLLKRLDPDRDTHALVRKAEHLVAAIDKKFWNHRERCYIEGVDRLEGVPLITQLAQACAILSGRLSADRRRALAVSLVRDDLLAPELFMHHFVLRAMVATGQSRAALERIRRHWKPVLDSGSPTIWELGVHTIGKAGFGGVGSLCHGFSTTPIDFIQGVVLGIRPISAGFSRAIFNPSDVGLAHAQGRIPTPAGNLHVAWRRDGGAIHADLTIPACVIVDLPDGKSLGAGRHAVTLAS
jgi:hypothetical protein